ncbi:uncharacterized protein LOC128892458 [Hylaeus anthracinus]|uniref:uncharacterized protein LOC128892458 n=1 Tax=Hylaeus anthracinus TaxID=313031 RepID=UPI0023B9A59D|nr:uncharacterized protein LOC128892458 [Hylaeus anthracinus]
MTVKRAGKGDRVLRISKMSPVPAHGLITENVLVPIAKTIFTKKPGTARSNLSQRRTEVIKPRKPSDNFMVPLLKRPSHLPAKRYTSTVLRSEQVFLISILIKIRRSMCFQNHGNANCREKKTISKKKQFRSIDKSSTFPAFGRFEHTSLDKKKSMLPFPSTIYDLPAATFEKREKIVSTSKYPTEANKWNGSHRIREEETRTVGHVVSEVSNDDNTCESVSDNVAFQSLSDLREIDWFSADTLKTIFDKEMQMMEINTSNVPITLTVAAASTATIKTNIYPCKEQLTGPYHNFASTNTDNAAKKTLSNIIPHSKESQFPAKWNAMNASNLHTDQFLETNKTPGILGDTCKEILKYTDRSRLSSLAENNDKLKNEHPCRIKYSWQVLGRGAQTSRTLLESLTKENNQEESVHDCCIKYSWQIIGTATQTSKTDSTAKDCRSALSVLSPRANANRGNTTGTNNALPVTVCRNGKKFFILNNQCTQTSAHKENQTNLAEIHGNH